MGAVLGLVSRSCRSCGGRLAAGIVYCCSAITADRVAFWMLLSMLL